MDTHTLQVLEFETIKKLIAGQTTSPLGKAKIIAAEPDNSFDKIDVRSRRLREMMDLIDDIHSVPGSGVPEIDDIVETIRIEGTVLDTEGFLALWQFLRGARHMRKCIRTYEDSPVDALRELAGQIEPPVKLEKAIAFVFTEEGKIKDSASKRLKEIRKEIRGLRKSIMSKLTSIIDKKRGEECLYNDQITIREGRYVLFVKSEQRTHIDGVIHDKSISGATCFVEPTAIIEQGNRMRTLRFDERNEIMRIKRFLSAMVREHADIIGAMIEPVAQFEYLIAAARFGLAYGMSAPSLHRGHDLSIVNGNHPLLLTRIGSKTVPISVDITKQGRCLIITGPNMGGKTVALKTIGLLCLMAQSGLPVPVGRESLFPVYDAIFADIGDEQSLQNDMSTFSSHVSRIIHILHKSQPHTLVLIDEFGTGTDPQEGAALAIAILEAFLHKKMYVVANTHLFRLKEFAASVNGVRNASMLFDAQTSAPTYQLVMDIPGSSNALEIAKKLGLSSSIINRAREMLGKEPDSVAELTRQLHTERVELIKEKEQCREDQKTYKVLMKRYKDKLLKFEDQKESTLRAKLSEMETFIKQIKKDFEAAVSDLKFTDERKLKDARRKWESFHRQIKTQHDELIEQGADEVEEIEALQPVEKEEKIAPYTQWQEGDTVRVAPFNFEGRIVAVNHKKKRATVKTDTGNVEAGLRDLTIVRTARSPEPQEPAPAHVSFHIAAGNRGSFNPTLDLRGEYVDRGIELLEKHVSDVIMYGFKSFTVIHGFGTGKMKRAVHEYLRSQPQIHRIRPGGQNEGGLGVTVAELE